MLNKKNKGFTLAEVLISLVIIGVIAAMTIPTLINKTNKQEYASKLKKAYSTMSQATNRIIADEGNPRGDIGGWGTSTEAIFNMYKKYLSNTKVCPNNVTGCFAGIYKRMNGKKSSIESGVNQYGLILADGTALSFSESGFNSSCSLNSNGTNNYCLHIIVDVNGPKGPNFVGTDTFGFMLKENGLFPTGCDYGTDNCPNATNGWDCSCKVIRDGAINY